MEERNEISVELSALSELVSRIGRENPYGVPVGYFAQLPALVMSRIASGLTIFPVAGPAFQVPEGYFEGFAASVLSRIKSVVGGSSDVESARMPVMGEGVEEELLRLSAVVSRISRKSPYVLPEGYFEELSPVLTVAHDRVGYQVPAGYFAGLPETVLEKVAGLVPSAKVVPMAAVVAARREDGRREGGKVLKGNWWKYSSVASIAACLLLIFSWPQVDSRFSEGAVMAQTTRGLEKLSDQEILGYLDDHYSVLAVSAVNSTAALDPGTAALDMNEGEVKSLLGEVSDGDLQQYMEEHGKADDLATN